MDQIRFFAELGGILLGVIACPVLIVFFLRSHKIPECFSCGASKVRPSRVEGFWDLLGNAVLIRPYRCSGCRERFHAFSPLAGSDVQFVRPQRVIRVAFRFRAGLPNRIVIRISNLNSPESTPASLAANLG
jgi:hypothetical protein